MSNNSERVEKAISNLRCDMGYFRSVVTDKDGLLRKMCDYAEYESNRQRCEPWSIVKQITGHGSGVSAAICEIYRRRDDD